MVRLPSRPTWLQTNITKTILRGNWFCFLQNTFHLARKRSQTYYNNNCFRELFCNNFGQDGRSSSARIGWSRMSGRRTSGTSRPSLGVQVLTVFPSCPRENSSLKMSGKTQGSPRQPSSSHPWPSERMSTLPSAAKMITKQLFRKKCSGRINFVMTSKADLIKWWGVELSLYFLAVGRDMDYKINLWPESILKYPPPLQKKEYLRKKLPEELFSGRLRHFRVINFAKEFSENYFLGNYVNFA